MKIPFFFVSTLISCFSFSQSFINEVIVKAPSPSSASTNSLVFWSGTEWVGREGIELFNPTCEVLDLSHWFLVVHGSSQQLRGTFRFPTGTTVAVEGLITIGGPFTQNTPGAEASDINLANFVSDPDHLLGVHDNRLYLDNTRGYVALYDANGVPMDAVYWHGTSTGEGCGSWGNASWYTPHTANQEWIPSGSPGAPVVTVLPGAGSSELSSVARCAVYLAGFGDGSAQNNGNGNTSIGRVNTITYGNDNAGTWDPINCITLPVELVDFYSDCLSENYARLNWQTASELNNNFFSIYRSDDGVNWSLVDRVDGHGTTSHTINYEWIDIHARSNKVIYYKLTQTDYDGTVNELGLVSSYCNSNEVVVVPNPAKEYLTIHGVENGESVAIIDAIGRVVYEKNNFSSGERINISFLQNGNYVLQLRGENKFVVKTFIKLD